MGLFSNDKTCRQDAKCSCGAQKQSAAAAHPPGFRAASLEPTTPDQLKRPEKMRGGGDAAPPSTISEKGNTPHPPSQNKIDVYVQFVRGAAVPVSPALIRGLVTRHLSQTPDLSKTAVLRLIRAQTATA